MPISKSPSRDVFVIHAEEDASLAALIVEFLEGRGIQGWIRSRDFPEDDERAAAILAAMASARVLVVVYSAAANESRLVQAEVLRALESNKLVIPFRLTQVSPAGSLELLLRRRYSISALRPPLEALLEELCRIIKPFANQPRKIAVEASISRTLPARAAILADPPLSTPSREPMGPFQAAIDCPRIAGRGVPGAVELIVANQGQQILEEVEVELYGETIEAPQREIIPDLLPGTQARLSFQFRPSGPVACVLHFSIRGFDSLTKFAYHGAQSLKVSGSGEDTIVARGVRGNSPMPDPQHAEVTRATMTFARSEEEAAPPTITLPDNFTPLPLTLDYAHSLDAEVVDKSRSSLAIPFAFLGQREDGNLLTLERVDGASPQPHQDIRISAKPTFVLGRSREEADLLLWFWPRNEIHDAKTLRISKKQCTLSLERGECRIRDTASASMTTYEDVSLTETSAVLRRRGMLNLSGNYLLELLKIEPVNGAPLTISNLESWKGPVSADSPTTPGCVRFKAASANVLPQSACWLLSEGTFGTSQANALVLELPGLAEIQGRFRYYQNCFWLENGVDNGAVVIDNHVVKARTIVPIVTGKIIKLAGVSFRPRIKS